VTLGGFLPCKTFFKNVRSLSLKAFGLRLESSLSYSVWLLAEKKLDHWRGVPHFMACGQASWYNLYLYISGTVTLLWLSYQSLISKMVYCMKLCWQVGKTEDTASPLNPFVIYIYNEVYDLFEGCV